MKEKRLFDLFEASFMLEIKNHIDWHKDFFIIKLSNNKKIKIRTERI